MSRLVARAESWEKVYEAFQNVNFAAFDYNTVKQSLLEYIKLYFPETFNDFIESSEFIAIVEAFSYIAELLAYRLDINAHENFMSAAQRKDSILRLAKFISYTASRPLPARGLVKLTSISTTESVIDTNGNDLANRTIRWNDVSNPNWKDQFILVMNRATEQEFGSVGPTDRFQIQDVLFELYSWDLTPLTTGVFSYTANVNGQSVPMELVPVTYNQTQGIVERRPANSANFTFLYGQDGLGDSSDTTGFFCFTKQGTLQRHRTSFDGVTPNQTYDINADNINDTDIWVNNVDPVTGLTVDTTSTVDGKTGEWVEVDLAHSQNVIFNTNPKRNKYEVETRNNNRARLIFGDGEFADIPLGTFDIWARSSLDQDIVVPQASVVNTQASFTYVDSFGRAQTMTFGFSLIGSLQNASAAETLEHIRATAPAIYAVQDRMVNGQDYNSFLLQDPSILKLRAINRTFAGDSKYIVWHDASGTYENVKMFGDDGILYFENRLTPITTPVVDVNTLITTYLEPLLSSTDLYMQMAAVNVPISSYRRVFSTDEKTSITSALTSGAPPAQVDLYYCLVANGSFNQYQWYAIKRSIGPVTSLGVDWESYFITMPLIAIDQTTVFETSYKVTRTARHMVFQSDTTKFWNTNEAERVIEYDTLRSDNDNIVVLQANVNYNRSGILASNYTFDVLGQETSESGPDIGLPDINRLSVIPADTNSDGIPDNVTVDDIENHLGVADIVMPKYYQLVTNLAALNVSLVGQELPALPIYYTIDPATGASGDVELYAQSSPGVYDVKLLNEDQVTVGWDWEPATTAGVYVTNRVRLLAPAAAKISSTFADSNIMVKIKEYVYFTRSTPSDPWVTAPNTPETMASYVQDRILEGEQPNYAPLWKRHEGRSDLNFAWFHRSPRYHLVDPAPSNLIDMYIISKGYYLSLKRWLEDPLAVQPTLPTPLELRTSYSYMLDNKMISDTCILHPGKIKLLFGARAAPALRAKFEVIRSNDRSLTDNQIKTTIVATVRDFFNITQWEFGETFYFTELVTAIHAALPTEISSCLIVPTFAQSQFGDMMQIQAREDEVLYPDITVDNIEIVAGYTPTNLRLNG